MYIGIIMINKAEIRKILQMDANKVNEFEYKLNTYSIYLLFITHNSYATITPRVFIDLWFYENYRTTL